MISIRELSLNAEHIWQALHGFPFCEFSQFIAFANILAVEVFPVPLGPVKR